MKRISFALVFLFFTIPRWLPAPPPVRLYPIPPAQMPLFAPTDEEAHRARQRLPPGVMVITSEAAEKRRERARELQRRTNILRLFRQGQLDKLSWTDLADIRALEPAESRKIWEGLARSGELQGFTAEKINYVKLFHADLYPQVVARLRAADLPYEFDEELVFDPRGASGGRCAALAFIMGGK